MREIRLSGSEGGGTGNSTGSPYPYPQAPDISERAMPAIQAAVSAMVLGPEQAASTTNGAGRAPEGNTIADIPRLRPPGL